MHTTQDRISFTSWKRALKPGTEILCVQNTKRPELNGKLRVVTKPQTTGIRYREKDKTESCYTQYPKAADTVMLDRDTVRWKLGGTEDTVTLQIIKTVDSGETAASSALIDALKQAQKNMTHSAMCLSTIERGEWACSCGFERAYDAASVAILQAEGRR